MAEIKIYPVDHLGEEVRLEPFEEYRVTEVVSILSVPDNAPGGVDEIRIKLRVSPL